MENVNDKKKTNIAIFLAIFANVIWGFGNCFLRLAYVYADTVVTLAYRFFVAFVLLNLWFLFGKEKISLKGKNIKVLLLYVLIIPINFFLESYGIYLTNAAFSGVIVAISPVFAIVFSCIWLKEYPTRKQTLFCFLPIIGVIIITISGKDLGVASAVGIIILLVYSVSSGAYKVVNRKLSNDFTAFERTYFLIGGCFITYIPYALIKTNCDFSVLLEPAKHIGFVLSILALAILNSIVANALINYSAKYISATKMANFVSIFTLTTALSGIIILGEPFSLSMLIGMILILIGVYVVTKDGK